MRIIRREPTWKKLLGRSTGVSLASAARSGLAAGATLVVLSAASAAASAARRRAEGAS